MLCWQLKYCDGVVIDGDATGVPRMDSPPTVSPKFFHSHRHTYPMGQTNVPADIFLLHIDIGVF